MISPTLICFDLFYYSFIVLLMRRRCEGGAMGIDSEKSENGVQISDEFVIFTYVQIH